MKNQFLEISNRIKAILTKKYGSALTQTKQYYSTVWTSKITLETTFDVVHNKRSDERLRFPHATFKITIKYERGKLFISCNQSTNSVDVNYMLYDKKINKRNVSIARAQYRAVDSYLHGTFRKKLNALIEEYSTPQFIQLAETEILRRWQRERLRGELSKIGTKLLDLALPGSRKEKSTYFFRGQKIGTRKTVRSFVRSNAALFIEDYSTKYNLVDAL